MSLKQVESYHFLVDVNLPKKFNFFNDANFVHITDIDPRMQDKRIWDYALAHNYIILTKDTDFYDLYLTSEKYPKVVYFRIGNLTLSELHQYFKKYWLQIVDHLDTASFIIAEENRISIFK